MADARKTGGFGGSISEQTVRKVARLARLELSEGAISTYTEQLASVLGYVERLQSLDLSEAEPMAHPLDATNRTEADEPGEMLSTEALMKMAPDTEPPFVRVPKVLGEGGA